MKFGGSSVGSTERQRQLVSIVRRAAEEERLLVVVSALSGVTRQLDAAFATAARKQPTAEALDALGARHHTQAAQLLSPGALSRYKAFLDKRLAALEKLLAEVRARGGTPAWTAKKPPRRSAPGTPACREAPCRWWPASSAPPRRAR